MSAVLRLMFCPSPHCISHESGSVAWLAHLHVNAFGQITVKKYPFLTRCSLRFKLKRGFIETFTP